MPFVDAAVRFIIEVLFNGLWIAALLAAVAWLALRAMPNGNATTRHSVLAAALYASLLLPIVAAILTTIPRVHQIPSSQTSAGFVSQKAFLPRIGNGAAGSHGVAGAQPPHAGAAGLVRAITPEPAIVRPNVVLPRPLALTIVAAWLVGVTIVFARLFLGLRYLERLKSDALPIPIAYRAQLQRWTAVSKGSRNVRLCRSGEIAVPIAVGLFDAMILIPERLLDELPPDDIDSIVLHELAHLRRGDDWINAVERIAQAALFFSPGILWLVSQLDLEREVACDDWVLQQNKALPYATCLARIVESVSWPYKAISAPGAFVTRRGMSVRIERLLASHRDVRVRTSAGPTGVAIAALATLCIAAALVAPSFAYSKSDDTLPIVAATARPAHAKIHASPSGTTAPPAPAHKSTPAQSAHAAKPGDASSAGATRTPGGPVRVAKTTGAAVTAATAHTQTPERPANGMLLASAPPSRLVALTESADPSIERTIQVAANSPDYIDSLASVGYTNLSIDELVQLKAVGVTADYIRAVEDAGIPHPSVRELIRLRAIGVQADYVRAMRAHFGSSASIEQIARLRAVGVSDAYLRDLAGAGYPNLTIEEAAQLRAMGIDSKYIALATSHGMRNLTVQQLIRLKASGIL